MKVLDEKIKKDIIDRFYDDDRIDGSKIDVDVENGTVTLNGTVPSHSARRAAWDDTWEVAGVMYVKNNIDIKYWAPSPIDADIQSQIIMLFDKEPDLDYTDFNITVTNGYVRMEGTVNIPQKKHKAENLVKSLGSVIDVEDRIAIVPAENNFDKAIAQCITEELAKHSTINVNNIDVNVEMGEVTLSGVVPSAFAQREAANIVANTFGVKYIHDHLRVKGK